MSKQLVLDEKPQGKGVTIYLPGDVMDALDDICDACNGKRSQVIAQLIRNQAGKRK